MNARYQPIDDAWNVVARAGGMLPPITRIEAARATKRLVRHFGGLKDGSPSMLRPARVPGVRRCWIAPRWSTSLKGWPRLVHDVSHHVFEARHPRARPHDGGHAALELEMTQYAIGKGWLAGPLRPPTKPKPTALERWQANLNRTTAGIHRWQSKLKRAQTALRKLERRRRRLMKGYINPGETA